ncbi:MAG: hypothetical protein ACPG77_15170, partial [Nannocystaceae bacterium]
MGHAQAQQPPAASGAIALDWQAPVGCPPGDSIERDVVRRLAAVPDWRERVSDLRVRAAVTGEGAHWQLRLEIEQEGQVGQRVVAGQTCQEIADATSLLVAMTVDPSANLEPVAPGPPAEPVGEPQAVAPTTPVETPENPTARAEIPAPARHPTAREKPVEQVLPDPQPTRTAAASDDEARPVVELAIGPAFGTSGLPATGFGLTGGAALVATRFRVEIEGSYWFPRSRPVADLAGASVSFRLATVGVRGCARLVHGKVEVPLCGGVLAGGLRGDSSGLARD